MRELQEDIAKAIHDSHEHDPQLYGSWEEEVAAAKTIDSVHPSYTDPYVGRVRNDAAAAIAAFTEALLSEPVVEAAASALLGETQRRIGFDPEECKALDELVSVVRQDYLMDARAALITALVAMGAVAED